MTTTYSATQARANIYKIIDDARNSHRPVVITGRRSNVVMISEEDWNAIQETLYLTSIPGMRDSIVKGMSQAIEDCDTEVKW
jgi:antitoxin YefM